LVWKYIFLGNFIIFTWNYQFFPVIQKLKFMHVFKTKIWRWIQIIGQIFDHESGQKWGFWGANQV
jgi:hypothetical protein